MSGTTITSPETETFIEKARKRYEAARQDDELDRREAEDDVRFAYAEDSNLGQWDEKAKRARRRRPTIQWNRIPTYTQQVVNNGRQNKPAIKITALQGGIPETATMFADRIRQIEYDSDADTAKDTCREQQVTSARAFIRVGLEKIPGKEEQRITIEAIPNQFSVVFGGNPQKYTCSDADCCFVISYITQDEHKRLYGEDSIVSQLDFATMGPNNPAPSWVGVGKDGRLIQVAEYWLKEYDSEDPEKYTITQYIINGVEILDKTPWIGSTIPIVPVWGKQAVVEGKIRTFSLIRNAKSPQRLVNLAVSNIVEKLGQMAKTPYKVPVGGIPIGNERDWQTVNNTELAFVLFNAYDEDGKPLPPPDRVDYEPPIAGLIELLNFSIDGMKAAMGIYDAALGNKSNEQSGIAQQERKEQSDVSNYHFPSNEARSNKYLGEILVDLIPKIDRPGSIVPVRAFDGKTSLVPIGTPTKDPKTGNMITHDLLNGQYGVAVSTGPTFDAARDEENDRLEHIIEAAPEMLGVIGDLAFRTENTPNAQEIADRVERWINIKTPGLIQQGQDGAVDTQNLQVQLQQAQAQLQKVNGFAQSLHQQIETKAPQLAVEQAKNEADIALRKYICDEQEKTKRTLGLATVDAGAAIQKLEAELGILKTKMQVLADAHSQASQQAHEKEQAEIAGQQAQQMASQQQSAAAQSQDTAHQQGLETADHQAELQAEAPEAE
jgi:hypothetical protein